MKRRLMFVLTFLLLGTIVACSKPAPPNGINGKSNINANSNTNNQQESFTTPEEMGNAPIINVYLENSGSMDGYVNGPTDFENAVYDYLSDLQFADLGIKSGSKNELNLNYINSKVLMQRPDVEEFIRALEPNNFRIKGGNRGISDISNIIDTILSQTGPREVSVFISDCIFSPGNKYKKRDNADEYLKAQEISIRGRIRQQIIERPNFSIVMLRLLSEFDGIYYNKFDVGQRIKDKRPFYVWLMGDKVYLKRILEVIDINEIEGSGVKNVYMASAKVDKIPFNILMPKPGKGSYKLDNSIEPKTISNAKATSKGGDRKFEVSISVDFSNILLPEEYLIDENNYEVSNSAYSVEIKRYSGPNADKYTHEIKLILNKPVISRGLITISLKDKIPQWVYEYTDEEGNDVNNAMLKTYGLKFLVEGVNDAYSVENYGQITINIK
jgi:hypothetical protein